METRMVDLPKRKVGIVACSGEELPEGTVSRLAALRVLEQLRPAKTVTICLPLFLAGGEGDRAFAKFYPTISIDGCELRCAARATEKYSNKPAASIMVRDLIKDNALGQLEGRRKLNQAGIQAVEITARQIALAVDGLLGNLWSSKQGMFMEPGLAGDSQPEPGRESQVTACACGSGIPVQTLRIGGREVTLVGLPLIFQQFIEAEKVPDQVNITELMETIKIYNAIRVDEEPEYREALTMVYRELWRNERNP
jgi:uncharacterized metal-binding protein